MNKDQFVFINRLIKNLGNSFPECELSHDVKFLKEPPGNESCAIPASDMKEFELRIKFFR